MFTQMKGHSLLQREILKNHRKCVRIFQEVSFYNNLTRKAETCLEASPGSEDSSLFKLPLPMWRHLLH